MTWNNERAIEVPIIWDFVWKCQGRVLELGNVLSHYFPITHDVLDKYEIAEGVMNVDVVDFKSAMPYDLIVSISTIEHIDEDPREPYKILATIQNLKKCLGHYGMMVLTFPLGYNQVLDTLFTEGNIDLGQSYFMKRIAEYEWIQVDRESIDHARYNSPFPCGNVIVVSIYGRH